MTPWIILIQYPPLQYFQHNKSLESLLVSWSLITGLFTSNFKTTKDQSFISSSENYIYWLYLEAQCLYVSLLIFFLNTLKIVCTPPLGSLRFVKKRELWTNCQTANGNAKIENKNKRCCWAYDLCSSKRAKWCHTPFPWRCLVGARGAVCTLVEENLFALFLWVILYLEWLISTPF